MRSLPAGRGRGWRREIDTTTAATLRLVMVIHLADDTEKRLTDLVKQTGRSADELVKDAVDGYMDEVAKVCGMLDRRYDEVKCGKVTPFSSDEVEAYFREKSVAARDPLRNS